MKHKNPCEEITSWKRYFEGLKKLETELIEAYIELIEAAPLCEGKDLTKTEPMKSVLKELRELVAERNKKE